MSDTLGQHLQRDDDDTRGGGAVPAGTLGGRGGGVLGGGPPKNPFDHGGKWDSDNGGFAGGEVDRQLDWDSGKILDTGLTSDEPAKPLPEIEDPSSLPRTEDGGLLGDNGGLGSRGSSNPFDHGGKWDSDNGGFAGGEVDRQLGLAKDTNRRDDEVRRIKKKT